MRHRLCPPPPLLPLSASCPLLARVLMRMGWIAQLIQIKAPGVQVEDSTEFRQEPCAQKVLLQHCYGSPVHSRWVIGTRGMLLRRLEAACCGRAARLAGPHRAAALALCSLQERRLPGAASQPLEGGDRCFEDSTAAVLSLAGEQRYDGERGRRWGPRGRGAG